MMYAFYDKANASTLCLEGDAFKHLIKVRRARVNETLRLRNKTDATTYVYRIDTIDKKRATLSLETSIHDTPSTRPTLHLAWCSIDTKSIEKVLPMLVEMGVAHIEFIACERSQRNFLIDSARLQRIIETAMQQSGRTSLLTFNESSKTLQEYVQAYPQTYLLDFSKNSVQTIDTTQPMHIAIGCEGGITQEERALFAPQQIVGFTTPHVLRSETAAVSVAAILLAR